MRFLAAVFLFIGIIGGTQNNSYHVPQQINLNIRPQVYDYVFSRYPEEKIAKRYTDVIIKNSLRNQLHPMHVARQIRKESDYKFWVDNGLKSRQGIAVGPLQVKPHFWGHRVYYANGGAYAQTVRSSTNEWQSIIRHLKYIGVNVEIATDILRHYYDQHGDMRLAFFAFFCGPSSAQFQAMRTNRNALLSHHYIRAIFNDEF